MMIALPFGLRVIAAPAEEPVSLEEIKSRLRITIADEDSDLEAMAREAREMCEAACGRAFVTTTYSLFLDGFPCEYPQAIRVPRPPLASVAWVKYYDLAGTFQTLDAAAYHVATAAEPGRVQLAYGAVWPAAQYHRPESVEVRFTAGFGTAADVPAAARSAILLTVRAIREDPAGAVGVPPRARAFLDTLEYGEVR